jgi:hypothetical protein
MPIFATWKRTVARTIMSLSRLEREVITDSMHKIQSVEASLDQIDRSKLIDIEDIESCLKNADKSFRTALRAGVSEKDRR